MANDVRSPPAYCFLVGRRQAHQRSGCGADHDSHRAAPPQLEADLARPEVERDPSKRLQKVGAEQVQSDGRDVNRVKIIDSKGRVRVFWDDPAARPRDGKNGGKGRQDKPRTRSDDDGDPTL